jgi:hypothetical protein
MVAFARVIEAAEDDLLGGDGSLDVSTNAVDLIPRLELVAALSAEIAGRWTGSLMSPNRWLEPPNGTGRAFDPPNWPMVGGHHPHERSTSMHTHMKTCPDCNGDGVVDKDTDDERQCPTCGGLGFVPDDDDDHEEVIKTSRDLPHSVGGKP